jgi:hypothetical protein
VRTNVICTSNYCSCDVECDICGAGSLEEHGEVVSSIPDPRRGGTYWQTHYEACLDCLKAGVARFPDRLRKYARAIEEEARTRAQDLRQLATAEWSSVPGRTYADIMRKHQEHEEERQQRDRQEMNDALAELQATWPLYEFTANPRAKEN